MCIAEPLYVPVLGLARELGDREEHRHLASESRNGLDRARGSDDRAQSLLRDALSIAEEIGFEARGAERAGGFLRGPGALHERIWNAQALFFGAAEAQTLESGLHRDPADEAFLAPLIDQARAQVLGAERCVDRAAGRALSYDEANGGGRRLAREINDEWYGRQLNHSL
jgi:hypothetical protein